MNPTDAELKVLEVLWDHEPLTVRKIRALIRERDGVEWDSTTVYTLLMRLRDKGLVLVDDSGFAHVFRPKKSREQYFLSKFDPKPPALARALIEHLSDDQITNLIHHINKIKNRKK